MAQVNGTNNVNSASSRAQEERLDHHDSRKEFFDRIKKVAEKDKKRRRSIAGDEGPNELGNMQLVRQPMMPELKVSTTVSQAEKSTELMAQANNQEELALLKNAASAKEIGTLVELEANKLPVVNTEDKMKHAIAEQFDAAAAIADVKKSDADAAIANMSLQQSLLAHRMSEVSQAANTANTSNPQTNLQNQAQMQAANQLNQGQLATNAASSNLIYRFNKWNSSGAASVSVDMKVTETGEMSATFTPSDAEVGQRLNASLPMTNHGSRWQIDGDAQKKASTSDNHDEDKQA